MFRFKKALWAAGGVALLALVVALTPAGPAIAQNAKTVLVEVVNTPQVSGTVQAEQSGRWTFDLSQPIKVASSDANPVLVRDVDNAARRAFTLSGGCGISSTECEDTFDVPAAHRLVIETLSVELVGPVGTPHPVVVPGVHIFVATDNGDGTPVPRRYTIPVQQGRFVGTSSFLGLVQVRLYADPVTPGMGHSVRFKALRNSGASLGMTFDWSISGYMVKCGGFGLVGCPLP